MIENAKHSYSHSERFVQFRELDTTLHFIMFSHTIHSEDLSLLQFNWLHLGIFDIEIVDSVESAMKKTKFIDMNQKIQANEIN